MRLEVRTFVLARAVVYASLFVGLLLVVLPQRVLSWSGMVRPRVIGPVELAGVAVGIAGGALALWCVLTFAIVGRGTPAPFDPPRRLVVAGPYRHVRNPMYLGAGVALAGVAAFYGSIALFGYTALFLFGMHVFVVRYEEPTLARLFGGEYEVYRDTVRRWVPRIKPGSTSGAG